MTAFQCSQDMTLRQANNSLSNRNSFSNKDFGTCLQSNGQQAACDPKSFKDLLSAAQATCSTPKLMVVNPEQ